MRVTKFTRSTLAMRRERRYLLKQGWEFVGDTRGPCGSLWDFARHHQIIKDVRISVTGKALWVKIGERE